jgi:tetratricopeptide (TPR) repeat protein
MPAPRLGVPTLSHVCFETVQSCRLAGSLRACPTICRPAHHTTPGAFASFMSVLAAEPGHVPALLELAALYKGKGLLAEAREVLERALAAAPDDARARQALATVLTDLGTAAKASGALDDAVALYRSALEHWPSLAATHYNLVRRVPLAVAAGTSSGGTGVASTQVT